jgi:hypothetical protein
LNIYKKRMIYVIILLVISISISSLLDERKNKIIDVNATPVTNRTVIIDAGHGLPDGRS